MAIRRTIDSLAEEFASLRNVSKDNALRIALIEAIARKEEHDFEPEIVPEVVPVAEKVVALRAWTAYMDGQESGSRKVFEEIAMAASC
jgi:hypothetical protein